jgi:hypothetical protein
MDLGALVLHHHLSDYRVLFLFTHVLKQEYQIMFRRRALNLRTISFRDTLGKTYYLRRESCNMDSEKKREALKFWWLGMVSISCVVAIIVTVRSGSSSGANTTSAPSIAIDDPSTPAAPDIPPKAPKYQQKTASSEALCFKNHDEAMLFVIAARNNDVAGALAIQLRNSTLSAGTRVSVLLRDNPFDVALIESGTHIGERCYLMPDQLR